MAENQANITIRRIREALESGRSAGVPEIIRLIQELSSKAFTITVKELADLIEQDVAISAKVISAANTLGYNPMGVPVSTITQAIQVIGFDRIRNLAISLMLMENAERSLSNAEQRQTSAIALTSGVIARSIMRNRGTNDPEQAFVCASLRNYGRLLMTTFLIEDYRDALALADQIGDDQAYKRIFGLTPLELGYHLLLSAHLPKSILRSLQAVPEEIIQFGAHTQEDELLSIADFSANLCQLMTDSALSPEHFALKAGDLCKRYGKSLDIKIEAMDDLLTEINSELKQYSRQYNLQSLSNHVLRSVEARARKQTPPPDPIQRESAAERLKKRAAREAAAQGTHPTHHIAAKAPAEPDIDSTRQAPKRKSSDLPTRDLLAESDFKPHRRVLCNETPSNTEEIFLQGIKRLTDTIAAPPVDMRKVHQILQETLCEALQLDECLFFLRDASDGSYIPVFGAGALLAQVRGRRLVSASHRDVFAICLNRREDVLIEDALEPKIKPYIPEWMFRFSSIHSFILLPVQDQDKVFALICGARNGDLPIKLNAKELRQIKALRLHYATARRISAKA